jgi:FixJ family two-component response regulator
MKAMTGPVVMVVDDEPDVRAAIGLLLKSVGHQVRVFDSAQAYWGQYDPEQPGCLILDVRMSGMSGLELQEQLNRLEYHPPIIMVSGHGEIPMAVKAIKLGAVDFLPKPFSDQLLLDRVGQALRQDRASRDALKELRSIRSRFGRLTAREREVLCGVAQGKLNKVIAADLRLSTRTVEIHRAHVMEKMEVRSLSSLMRCVAVLEDSGIFTQTCAMAPGRATRPDEKCGL